MTSTTWVVIAVWALSSGMGWCKTFQDPRTGISLDYDEALWEVAPKKTAEAETIVNLQRKIADKEGDTSYFSRVSIVQDDLGKIKKLDSSKLPKLQAYQNHAADFLRSQRFDILSSEIKTVPGNNNTRFEMVARQRDFGLTYQQVGFVVGNTAYLVTATVRTKKFPEYQKELEQMFQSLKWNP